MSLDGNKRVYWYEHDCDWISKYCDEHHMRSATVREIKAAAWVEGYFAGRGDEQRRHVGSGDFTATDNPYLTP